MVASEKVGGSSFQQVGTYTPEKLAPLQDVKYDFLNINKITQIQKQWWFSLLVFPTNIQCPKELHWERNTTCIHI